jgi:hypothetical protein
VNAKGRSEPVIIDDISFKGVAKFTGEFKSSFMFSREFEFKIYYANKVKASRELPYNFYVFLSVNFNREYFGSYSNANE